MGILALPFRPLYNKMSLLSFQLPISIVQGCQSYFQFHRHTFLSQTLSHDFEPFLIHLEVLGYKGPKLSFHIQGLDVPFLYKLLLSHLGDRRI